MIINNIIGKIGVNLSSWVESVPQCIRWDPGSSILHPVVLYTLGKGLALNFSTLRGEEYARTICFYIQYLLHLFSPNREFYVSSILEVRWGRRHILGDKGPLNRAFFMYLLCGLRSVQNLGGEGEKICACIYGWGLFLGRFLDCRESRMPFVTLLQDTEELKKLAQWLCASLLHGKGAQVCILSLFTLGRAMGWDWYAYLHYKMTLVH